MDAAEEKDGPDKEFEQRCIDYGKAIEEGRHDDAEQAAMDMFMAVALKAATEEPSQSMIWNGIADECEMAGNWEAAIDARRKVIAPAYEDANRVLALKPHLDLASLFDLLARRREATVEIDQAVEIGRQSDIPTLRSMAFEAKARDALANEDLEGARAWALDVLKGIPDDRLHHLLKAQGLVLLARMEIESGNVEAAEASLIQANELIRPYGDSHFMGGVQSFFARAAEVRAKIEWQRGEKEQAITSFEEVLRRVRTISDQPHLASVRTRMRLVRTLEGYKELLSNAGRAAEAAEIGLESSELRKTMRLS